MFRLFVSLTFILCADEINWAGSLEITPLGPALELFAAHEEGYEAFRVPVIEPTKDGALLAIAEGRLGNRSDKAYTRLMMKRSTDDGRTWSKAAVLWGDGASVLQNCGTVVDASSGTIYLFFAKDGKETWLAHSTDGGLTWKPPVDMTKTLQAPLQYGCLVPGPGHGVQISAGPHQGRLVRTGYAKFSESPNFKAGSKSIAAYSDDHGKTWKMGAPTVESTPKGPDGNECMAVELADGRLYMTIRNNLTTIRRAFAISDDGGETWSKVQLEPQLPEPVCEASVLRLPRAGRPALILYAGPSVQATGRKDKSARQKLSIWASEDQAKTWELKTQVHPTRSAYSDMAPLRDGGIGIVYEADGPDGDRMLFRTYKVTAP